MSVLSHSLSAVGWKSASKNVSNVKREFTFCSSFFYSFPQSQLVMSAEAVAIIAPPKQTSAAADFIAGK